MASTDFTSVLSVLLSDATILELFCQDKESFCARLDISTADRDMLRQLSSEQIRTQAGLLSTKRMREVSKLIPITVKMNQTQYAVLFRQYAQRNWPEHYNRHILDAYHFCHFLKSCSLPYSKYERLKLASTLGKRSLGFVFTKDVVTALKRRWVFLLVFSWRKKPREWRFYFSL